MSAARLFSFSAFMSALAAAIAAPGDVERITSAPNGALATNPSWCGDISRGGRFVAFSSSAGNLIANDTNGGWDAFLRDRQTGTNLRLSLYPDGAEVPNGSFFNTMSTDGRFYCFDARDRLLPEVLSFVNNVYLVDRQTGQMELVSKSTAGVSANANSYAHSISADGRYVAFTSSAKNLGSGDVGTCVYLRDRVNGTTTLVSTLTNGQILNGIQFVEMSDDGRYVAFQSNSRPYVKDLQTGITRMVAVTPSGHASAFGTHYLDISRNGRFVVFSSIGDDLVSGDTNGEVDTFVYDMKTRITTRVSVSSTGVQSDREASDGRISEDGRLVIFYSHSSTFDVYGDVGYGIFMHDRFTGETKRVSLKPDGTPAGGSCVDTQIDPEGRFVSYRTRGLVIGSANSFDQVYLQELAAPNQMLSFSLLRTVLAGANRTVGTITMAQGGIGGPRVALSESSNSVSIPPYVQFADNSTTANFNVVVSQVTAAEVVPITATYCDQTQVVNLTLVPLAPSAFEFTPSPVVGGNAIAARLVLNGVAGPGGEVVSLSDDNVFAATPATVMVPPGAPQVNFSIPTLPVVARQYVTVTATTPGGSKTGLFVIRP